MQINSNPTSLTSYYQPITTFTQRPTPGQIVVYVLSILQLLTAYIIVQHRLYGGFRVGFVVVFTVAWIVMFVLAVLVSAVDPSDQLMKLCKAKSTPQIQQEIVQIKNRVKNYLYCRECASFVKPSSKHCRKCNRCVQAFDHHCIWLNNCIGILNYKIFIGLLWTVQITMSIFLAGCSVLSQQYSNNNININNNNYNNNNNNNTMDIPLNEMIIVWIMMGLVGIFWILNFNLVFLHLYLMCLGLTTYQWLFPGTRAEKIGGLFQRNRRRVDNQDQIVGNQNMQFQDTEIGLGYDGVGQHEVKGEIQFQPQEAEDHVPRFKQFGSDRNPSDRHIHSKSLAFPTSQKTNLKIHPSQTTPMPKITHNPLPTNQLPNKPYSSSPSPSASPSFSSQKIGALPLPLQVRQKLPQSNSSMQDVKKSETQELTISLSPSKSDFTDLRNNQGDIIRNIGAIQTKDGHQNGGNFDGVRSLVVLPRREFQGRGEVRVGEGEGQGGAREKGIQSKFKKAGKEFNHLSQKKSENIVRKSKITKSLHRLFELSGSCEILQPKKNFFDDSKGNLKDNDNQKEHPNF